jgi:hypothetical protein
MSRKNLTRRIAALALAATLALPGVALARPGRHAGASPWGPLWTWLTSWIVRVATDHPVGSSSAKAGATVDPDGRSTRLDIQPPAPAAPLPTSPGAGTTSGGS